jgi:hypothetical protein
MPMRAIEPYQRRDAILPSSKECDRPAHPGAIGRCRLLPVASVTDQGCGSQRTSKATEFAR